MLDKSSLVTRIAIGITVGFILGLVGFLMFPHVLPDVDPMLRWGFLLWYMTLGAVITVFGVLDWQPVLDLAMPWWIRAPLIAAWMNFVLTLLICHHLRDFSLALFGQDGILTSPFWFVGEGVLVGLIIGFACTRFGDGGPGTGER